jgi:hypothetical protein
MQRVIGGRAAGPQPDPQVSPPLGKARSEAA